MSKYQHLPPRFLSQELGSIACLFLPHVSIYVCTCAVPTRNPLGSDLEARNLQRSWIWGKCVYFKIARKTLR